MRCFLIVVAAMAAVGCVEERFPPGIACAGDGTCPPGQRCFDGVCDFRPPDAAVPTPDAPTPDAVVPDAVAPDAAAASCDPIAQGCGDGMACYWDASGSTCATAGAGLPHTPCTLDGDCRAGAGCATTPFGFECAPYCDVANPVQCLSLDACVPLDGDVGHCVFAGCSPTAQDCMPAEGCYWNPAMMMGICNMTPGSATQGMACTPPNGCVAGSHCHNCGGSFACSRYCDPAKGDADCAGTGETCTTIGEGVGVCSGCP